MPGPLSSLRVLEFAGLGAGPFCAMLLADLGADVLRVDRGEGSGDLDAVLRRSRPSLALDLKSDAGRSMAHDLAARADAVIEGFRPGVMERLGLGPDVLLAANPRLVYGRMTGWGQTGPYAQAAGHDINYLALSGALHAIGSAEKPMPPLNLIGDFGGGALYLAMGLLAAILHARQEGRGQVVDCSMVDGAASLMTMIYGLKAAGRWTDARAANLLDGGAPYYDTYCCACGGWIAVGAIEPQFYRELLQLLGLTELRPEDQDDRERWPEARRRFTAVIAERSRAEWTSVFEGTDACVSPVLALGDAPNHPHNIERRTFVEAGDVRLPAPAPRFSETPGRIRAELSGARLTSEDAQIRWV